MENKEKRIIRNANTVEKAGKNLSWGAVFAGAVTFTAVFTVLNLITAALGFGIFSPNDSNTLSNVAIGTSIWTVVTLVISFLCGGYVAGLSARKEGMLHGLLTWSLSILLLFTFVSSMIAQALGLATSTISTIGGGAKDVVGSTVSTVSDSIGDQISKIDIDASSVDTQELQDNVNEILADTDVKELQPDYLENILNDSKDELVEAGKDVVLNPENAESTMDDLLSSLETKAETISNAADKDAIASAVESNTDLSQAEAEEATDNIYNGLQNASDQAIEQINKAEESIEDLKVEAKQTVDDTKDGVETASNKLSAGAVIIFVSLLIGLALTIFASKKAVDNIR